MYRKGRRAVAEICRSLRKLKCIDRSVFWKLFDTQVEPILMNGADTWGLLENDYIEKVHTLAIKCSINVPIHSSNKMVCAEMGRYPLHIRTKIK